MRSRREWSIDLLPEQDVAELCSVEGDEDLPIADVARTRAGDEQVCGRVCRRLAGRFVHAKLYRFALVSSSRRPTVIR